MTKSFLMRPEYVIPVELDRKIGDLKSHFNHGFDDFNALIIETKKETIGELKTYIRNTKTDIISDVKNMLSDTEERIVSRLKAK